MKKNIRKVANLLADCFIEYNVRKKSYEKQKLFLNENKDRLGLFSKYIPYLLHDSWFIKTKISKNKFTFFLNDFSTHVFSDAIVAKNNLDIKHRLLVFPIKFEFDILELSYNLVDEDGFITQIEPTKIHEYLYEQIININDKFIEIAIVAWQNGKKNSYGQRILILIKAKNIKVTELQDLAWNKIFGNEYDDYYQYFKEQFNSERYVSDYHNCCILYDELELKIKNEIINAKIYQN